MTVRAHAKAALGELTAGRQLDPEMAKRIFSGYKRSLLIPTPVLAEDQMRQNIEEFNCLFDFRTEVRQGTLEILRSTWERAKQELAGNLS